MKNEIKNSQRKLIVLITIGIVMLVLIPVIFDTVSGFLSSHCPSYNERGHCELKNGLRMAVASIALTTMWGVGALTVLITCIYKITKLHKSKN